MYIYIFSNDYYYAVKIGEPGIYEGGTECFHKLIITNVSDTNDFLP